MNPVWITILFERLLPIKSDRFVLDVGSQYIDIVCFCLRCCKHFVGQTIVKFGLSARIKISLRLANCLVSPIPELRNESVLGQAPVESIALWVITN